MGQYKETKKDIVMEKVQLGGITLYNEDCMEFLRQCKDKEFDLAIVDPPTAQKYARGKNGWGVNDNRPTLDDVSWDSAIPTKEYFDELFRVSKNQIIWCGIYYTHLIPQSKCWVVWDKTGLNVNTSPFADCELAWTSFNEVVRKYTLVQMGFIKGSKDKSRIHPTQKPVELYKWLLAHYAKPGDCILDTHLGSGSIAIACHDGGFELTGIEIDKYYFDKAVERIKTHQQQLSLF